ncbi:MAG: hypothetical protein AAGH57_11355 [Pseudomonadota bacterium]
MIGSEREALIDRVVSDQPPARFGGPLVIFSLLLVVWVTGRVALWESPLPGAGFMAEATQLLAQDALRSERELQGQFLNDDPSVREDLWPDLATSLLGEPDAAGGRRIYSGNGAFRPLLDDIGPAPALDPETVRLAQAHLRLRRAAAVPNVLGASWSARHSQAARAGPRQADVPVFPGTPPFVARPDLVSKRKRTNRWTLDAWAFLREGSGAAPIAQGRVPVYGASQAGAILQHRIAPQNRRDPRVYLRAYRALLDEPESEIAAGVSARPLPAIPVRLAAEARFTDNRFRNDLRPAVYAITEILPIGLPLGLSAEVYAGAGYVGGVADTAFVDGQASVVRRVASFDLAREDDVRLSFGAGAWGGAQRDANRLDVGPTMRVDMSLGAVPARVSIDYRERVGGDASPVSGVAATLSTQF